jgi:hypothetical protein
MLRVDPNTCESDMTAEIVNLRRARKAKARSAAEAEAQANRTTFGRSKAERKLTKAQSEAEGRKLDGHKRDDT